MKLEINLRIIFVLIIAFLFNNINTYFIFLVFISIHELSHFIVGIIGGWKPRKISIEPFGISLDFYNYNRFFGFNKVFFYIVGPLVNLICAIIFIKIPIALREEIVYINILLFLFNILPILPLDGGKILYELLKYYISEENSYNITINIGKVSLSLITFIYSIVIVKIHNIYILLLILYLWYLFINESKKINLYIKTKKVLNKID